MSRLPPVPERQPRRWRSLHAEALAGLAGAAAALPLVLTLGVLAFAATGTAAALLGVAAALAANVVGGLVVAALGRTPMPTAGPSTATTVIFASLVATLAADPALDLSRPAGLALLVAVAGLAVCAAGVLMIVMGLLHLGSLARYVPQPVLAGFMNGVALLILASQALPLLGLDSAAWAARGLSALTAEHALPLLLGLGTAALAWTLMRRRPHWPAQLLALLLGVLVAQAASALGATAVNYLPATPTVLPSALPWPLWADGAALLQRHAGALLLTALLIALLGGLESVLSIAATEAEFDFRSAPNRELVALGWANVASGLLGGMAVVYLRLRAVASWQAGGRSRLAAATGSLLLGAAFVFGQPLLGLMPVAVLAGLMVATALALIDGWSRQLAQQWWDGERSTELRESLAIVALVGLMTLALGFAAGVAVGLAVALIQFFRSMNQSLLRVRFDAAAQPSRRVYPRELEAVLLPARRRIEVIELEGALFFGNTERLTAVVEPLLRTRGHDVQILDLRRVSNIDASGAVTLGRLAARRAQRGGALWLAGVTQDNRHAHSLRAYGVLGEGRALRVFADTDRAIEAAERWLLEAAGAGPLAAPVPLAQCALVEGLTPAQLGTVRAFLEPRQLAPGERLFAEGDPGDRLYVLLDGLIDVVGSADADRRTRQRFVSFSPGMTLGETAMLDGGGRTADALADGACTLYELHRDALLALTAQHPVIAAALYRNLALHLSQRLRDAATAWRRAAG